MRIINSIKDIVNLRYTAFFLTYTISLKHDEFDSDLYKHSLETFYFRDVDSIEIKSIFDFMERTEDEYNLLLIYSDDYEALYVTQRTPGFYDKFILDEIARII